MINVLNSTAFAESLFGNSALAMTEVVRTTAIGDLFGDEVFLGLFYSSSSSSSSNSTGESGNGHGGNTGGGSNSNSILSSLGISLAAFQ